MKRKMEKIGILGVMAMLLATAMIGMFGMETKAEITPSSGWQWVRQIDISNAITNYQVRITLINATGTDDDANGIIYVGGKCSNFPFDVRFGSTDNFSNAVQLPQCLEIYNDTTAIYWVNILSYSTIYLFVGNQNANEYSNGDATFIYFNDGTKTTGFTTFSGSPNITTDGNYLDIHPTTDERAKIYTGDLISEGASLKVRFKQYGTNVNAQWIGFTHPSGDDFDYNAVYPCDSDLNDFWRIQSYIDGSYSPYNLTGLPDFYNFHIYETAWFNDGGTDTAKFWYDGTLKGTKTDNIPTTDMYVGIQTDHPSSQGLKIDYMFVRKYAEPEPSCNFGAWQNLEDNPSNYVYTEDFEDDTIGQIPHGDWYIFDNILNWDNKGSDMGPFAYNVTSSPTSGKALYVDDNCDNNGGCLGHHQYVIFHWDNRVKIDYFQCKFYYLHRAGGETASEAFVGIGNYSTYKSYENTPDDRMENRDATCCGTHIRFRGEQHEPHPYLYVYGPRENDGDIVVTSAPLYWEEWHTHRINFNWTTLEFEYLEDGISYGWYNMPIPAHNNSFNDNIEWKVGGIKDGTDCLAMGAYCDCDPCHFYIDDIEIGSPVPLTQPNNPPTCSLSANPTSGPAPLTVTFSMSASDSDGTIASWQLDVDNDGTPEYSGSGSPPSTQTHTYNDAGSYTAKLTVTDDDGATAYDTTSITVSSSGNNPPVADFSYTISYENNTVNFIDESSDSDGSIVSWLWDFGDGNTSTEQNPTHVYASKGTYDVTLTVTDDDGATDSITKTIVISDLIQQIENTNSLVISVLPIFILLGLVSSIVFYLKKKK